MSANWRTRGAGHPDLGLYAAKQVQRGQPREGQTPEGGAVEVKPAGDDAWLTAESTQVSRYWDSLRLGALSFDAVKHLVLCRLKGRPPRLDLELYPYLPRVRVNTTSAGDYMTLLSGRAA